MGLKIKYEVYYDVCYINKVLCVVVEFLVKYINECYLFDKVIDVIDEVGVWVCLMLVSCCKKMVGVVEIEFMVVKMVWILEKFVFFFDKDILKNLD